MALKGKDMEQLVAGGLDFRRPTLLGLLIFIMLFLAWHAVAEFRYGIRMLAFMEAAFVLYSAIIFFLVLKRPYSRWLALSVVLPSVAMILVVMFHPDTPVNAFVWLFLIPVLSYALLGRQLGVVLTLLSSVLALVAYLSKYGDRVEGVHYLMMTDVAICMSIIWVISHLYERYREKTIEAFHWLATTDELTGLQNRRQMKQAFNHLSVAAERLQQVLAVVVMDLDYFKQINDRWGHDAGDAVLSHVAGLLREYLRQSDWLFRTGGEEFCLLLPLENHESAMQVAEKLRRSIAETPCLYGGQTIALSASIGVALYPQEGAQLEPLLQRADQYMYAAKQQGRNRVSGAEIVRSVAQ